jgi:putative oxidoreductase
MRPAITALRVAIGTLFVGHGAQKLFGRFGGGGLEPSVAEMKALRLEPARANAVLAAATQCAGGAMVAAGFLTPVGTTLISANMVTAIRTACAGKGPWGLNGGWEYQLTLVLALAAIAEHGPGALSLDRAFKTELSGPAVALASLVASAGGSAAVVAIGQRLAPAPQ